MDEMILLINSSDPDNPYFGTGFIIHQVESISYVVTCYHVVRDVGGPDCIRVAKLPAKLIAFDEEDGFDLAVLEVENLPNVTPLSLGVSGERGNQFTTKGFAEFDNKRVRHVMRPLHGTLGEQIYLESKRQSIRINAWDLLLSEKEYTLEKGYSGAPIIDQTTEKVIAVASHRQVDGLRGNAISISALLQVWPDLPSDLIQVNSENDGDYEYDIFLSYYGDFSGEWVRRYFSPLLNWALQDKLGRNPAFYIAEQTRTASVAMELQYKLALAHSRCLVPIWSPSYFDLSWATQEMSIFFQRESFYGYGTKANPSRLILPTVVSDGKKFPPYVNDIPQFNCRNYMIPQAVFETLPIYMEFREKLNVWADEVASNISQAPSWQKKWIDANGVSLPIGTKPTFELTLLG